jgi:serine/threonine-protein kinase
MGIKCPKCNTDNPSDSKFCKECSTPLPSSKEIPVTKTLEKPIQELIGGTTFAGRYQIIEELGRGGMGVVYKAQDTKLKRTVALKFLPPELTHISEVKDRFIREAQAAAALDHPNICTVHEFDEAEDKTFISMAYIEGQSLKKKIESGPLELDEALRIATQVGEGLKEAHKKGVIHRDIKSANIMVDERGQAKIMDFGLARVAGGTLVTKEGMTMGTIAYMSPEQARGEEVDHRTDIWSLGVVLYEMFSGQLPFKGDHDQAVVYSILNEQPDQITNLRSEIPMSIEQLVGKALEKNPDERYQQIDDLLDDLRSISEGIVPEGVKARLRKAKLLRRKRAILYGGIAGVIIIMTVVALSLFTGHAGAIDSIAVLPLENLSGDPDQEYFSDGITDALINELSKISALRVISRTSMMQYKEVRKSLSEIARELNVDAVVEASVLTVGGRVQIRAQLIQASTEKNLWAQSYEREISDILVLQSEMARAIASEILVKLTPQEETRLASAHQVNPEAYEAYLKGRHYWSLWPEGSDRAIEYFQEATEKDPKYAPAYAGLALCYNFLGFLNRPPKEVYPKARAAALRALELDETLAEGHTAIGIVKLFFDWDWEGAERAWRRALELNPNSVEALRLSWNHLIWTKGQFEEGLAQARRARDLDPLNRFINSAAAYAYLTTRRYDEAIALYRRMLELYPNFGMARLQLAAVYTLKGMNTEALAEYKKLGEYPYPELGFLYAKMGRRDDARRVADKLIRISTQKYVSPFLVAILYAGLGDKDQAFAWLEKAYQDRSSLMAQLKVEASFDPLRSDPRFQDLLRRMNFPE